MNGLVVAWCWCWSRGRHPVGCGCIAVALSDINTCCSMFISSIPFTRMSCGPAAMLRLSQGHDTSLVLHCLRLCTLCMYVYGVCQSITCSHTVQSLCWISIPAFITLSSSTKGRGCADATSVLCMLLPQKQYLTCITASLCLVMAFHPCFHTNGLILACL
jgi:hypothetical protein